MALSEYRVSNYEKILIRRKIIFINKYDREEAAIEDNIAASKGLNPISNNSNNMTHRDRLLTISNIDHANIIFFIICFRILKLIWLLNPLVYLCLLSIWKRTINNILYTMNPTNTVTVEVNTLLGEYIAYNSAITALAKKPIIPAISKFLLIKIVSLYFL